MCVKFEIACEDFSFSYLPLYINKKYFFNWSRESWQLKAAHQVDSSPGRALQQELK